MQKQVGAAVADTLLSHNPKHTQRNATDVFLSELLFHIYQTSEPPLQTVVGLA